MSGVLETLREENKSLRAQLACAQEKLGEAEIEKRDLLEVLRAARKSLADAKNVSRAASQYSGQGYGERLDKVDAILENALIRLRELGIQ